MTKRPLLSANLKAKRPMRDAQREAAVAAAAVQPEPAPALAESVAAPAALLADEGFGADVVAAALPDAADSGAVPASDDAPVEAVEDTPAADRPDDGAAAMPEPAMALGEAPIAFDEPPTPPGLPVPFRLAMPTPLPALGWRFGPQAAGASGPAAILAEALIEMSVMPAVTFCRYSTVQMRLATSLLSVALRPF